MEYKIKEIREKKKMTQKELAEKSGVSRAMISFLEKKGQNATVEILQKIANALGCSVKSLL